MMKQNWEKDYYRMTGEEWKPGIKSLYQMAFSHQIRYMRLWRKAKQTPTLFAKYSLYRYSRKYGLEISLRATIGNGLYMGHPYNITVAGGVIIGNNVNLHKGCTIGRENRGERMGVPQIGDRVSIGINSTIIGKIRIGNDVMIAPNSFVNFDVPDHSVVIGNPGVIHRKENATEGYIQFLV